MTYNKPEVVKMDSALSSIQGSEKGDPDPIDGQPHDGTPNAYQSDE
jgi:hypothetical protein